MLPVVLGAATTIIAFQPCQPDRFHCHPDQCPEENQAFTICDVGFLSITREHKDQSCLKNCPLNPLICRY